MKRYGTKWSIEKNLAKFKMVYDDDEPEKVELCFRSSLVGTIGTKWDIFTLTEDQFTELKKFLDDNYDYMMSMFKEGKKSGKKK